MKRTILDIYLERRKLVLIQFKQFMAVPCGNYGGGGGSLHDLVQVRVISGLVYMSIGGGEVF